MALCLAGAWRDWPASWDPINKFIVEPLQDVDIYAISDTVRSGQHGKADPGWTVARMKSTFGTHFKAGERLGPAQLKNVSGESWPEIAAAQAALGSQGATVFSYLYKIWRCGQLIHKSGIKYDAIIRMRPDLWPMQEFRMARVPATNEIELQIGGRCVRFGPRAVVTHAYTNFCGNDWIAIGPPEAMTVTMDLLRFFTPTSRFLSPDSVFDSKFIYSIELALNWLWWRTGTAVLRRPLFVELSRRRCTTAGCLRMPAWTILPRLRPPSNKSKCLALPPRQQPPVGAVQRGRYGLVNDCGATERSVRGDLEWFTGPTPSRPSIPEPFAVIKNQSKTETQRLAEPERPLRSATPPTWTRPDCEDVFDLSVHNPLLPCKKTTGDEASYRPQAHRPKVRRGYGVPLVFTSSFNRTRLRARNRTHARPHDLVANVRNRPVRVID